MDGIPIIGIILGLIIAFGVIFVIIRVRSKEPYRPNYKLFFIIGITWIPLGLAVDNHAFPVLGVVFLTIGLLNKKKWKDEQKWSELSPEEKRLKLIAIFGLSVILLLGAITFFLYK